MNYFPIKTCSKEIFDNNFNKDKRKFKINYYIKEIKLILFMRNMNFFIYPKKKVLQNFFLNIHIYNFGLNNIY